MRFMVIRSHRNFGYDFYETDGWNYTLLGFADSEKDAYKLAGEPREWPKDAREVHIAIVPTELIPYPVELKDLMSSHMRDIFERFLEVARLKPGKREDS